MVCPRLLELDARHGEHLAGAKYPVSVEHWTTHDQNCDCLIDPEGHKTTTLVLPPGSEIADDHSALTCRCGRLLTPGEWL